MKRRVLEAEHEEFRKTVREFIERELEPNAEQWEAARLVDRSAWVAAGKFGLIGFNMPEEYGGGGVDDFRFNAVIDEEIARYGGPAPALSLQNDVVGPYFSGLASDEQKQRWLPGITSGELIVAGGMNGAGGGRGLARMRESRV